MGGKQHDDGNMPVLRRDYRPAQRGMQVLMSEDPVWKEPPPTVSGRNPRNERLKRAMRENPGRWLLWAENAPTLSVATKLRKEGFETTSRMKEGRTFDIYVRAPEGTPLPSADPVLVAQRERFEQARRKRLGVA